MRPYRRFEQRQRPLLRVEADADADRHRQIRVGVSELDVAHDRDVTVTEDVEDYLGQGRGRVGRPEPALALDVNRWMWWPSKLFKRHDDAEAPADRPYLEPASPAGDRPKLANPPSGKPGVDAFGAGLPVCDHGAGLNSLSAPRSR